MRARTILVCVGLSALTLGSLAGGQTPSPEPRGRKSPPVVGTAVRPSGRPQKIEGDVKARLAAVAQQSAERVKGGVAVALKNTVTLLHDTGRPDFRLLVVLSWDEKRFDQQAGGHLSKG
jgi:hypothetical protein